MLEIKPNYCILVEAIEEHAHANSEAQTAVVSQDEY